MDQKDIVIPQDKSKLLFNARQRVKSLFEVVVGGFSNKANKNSESQWINLKGSAANIEKAQKFINSLCSPEIEITVTFSADILKEIQEKCRELEKSNCVYICFPSNSRAIIQGNEQLDVAITQSNLEEFVKKNSSNTVTRDINSSGSNDIRQTELYGFDPSVTITESLDLDSLKDFASKLGYTEEDVQSVLKKLGKNVNKNQLLNELIQVNKSARFLRDERPRTNVQSYAQPQTYNGLNTVPRSDIVARGAPSSVPDRSVISRGASTAPTLDSDYIPRSFADRDVRASPVAPTGLRPIVIDGSNVAMSHGNQKVFSCRGIQLCVDWFLQRGHTEIFVFVPMWRKEASNPDAPITDQEILHTLEDKGYLKYTPARRVNGRRVICYDDRYIIKLAVEIDGIIVSNDNFRDLQNESEKFKEVIEKRLLMFSFVNDLFLPPDDPLGRYGPSLDEFLLKGTETSPRICPFLQKRKCTYGARCRFYHPERDGSSKKQPESSSKSVTESNSSSESAPRDFGVSAKHGAVLSPDAYSELNLGVSSGYAQQRVSGVNVRGHANAREHYHEGYNLPAPHQYPYDYGQMYHQQHQPQYMMPDPRQWTDSQYVVPRGHPQMGYPAVQYPHSGYPPQMQGLPPSSHIDFIPPMQAYPGNPAHGSLNSSRIIGDRRQQFQNLLDVFPRQEVKILTVMQNHPNERDVNRLAEYVYAIQ